MSAISTPDIFLADISQSANALSMLSEGNTFSGDRVEEMEERVEVGKSFFFSFFFG